MPDRFVAYVFDDLHLEPEHLAWVRNAVLHHLSDSRNPLERSAMYTTSGRNSVDFTGDYEPLRQAILALAPGGGRMGQSADCPPMTEFMADLIVNKHDLQALAVGVADYIDCAGPMPGRQGGRERRAANPVSGRRRCRQDPGRSQLRNRKTG